MESSSEIRKFRIEELLSRYTPATKREKLTELRNQLNISQGHLNLLRRASLASNITLKSDQLMILSRFFNVSMDDLFNDVENPKS